MKFVGKVLEKQNEQVATSILNIKTKIDLSRDFNDSSTPSHQNTSSNLSTMGRKLRVTLHPVEKNLLFSLLKL